MRERRRVESWKMGRGEGEGGRCYRSVVCPSVTLVHPAKDVGLNEMPFGRDTQLLITPILKCPIVKWICGLHTRINFHLAKLLAVDVILYLTAFLRSF